MDWVLRVKLHRNLIPKPWIALVEEDVVADVYHAPGVKHLDHDQLYAEASRFFSDFSNCSTSEVLQTGLCPGENSGRAPGLSVAIFGPNEAS